MRPVETATALLVAFMLIVVGMFAIAQVPVATANAADRVPDLPLVTIGKFEGYGTTYVYRFDDDGNECYFAYRTNATSISCMKKERN